MESSVEEKRRYKRLPIDLQLAINELFKQDQNGLEDLDITAQVVNISKDGIGFKSEKRIPIDYYFDCKITFDDDNYFYGVVKIIREEAEEDHFVYGCQFVGLAGFLADKVDEYAKKI